MSAPQGRLTLVQGQPVMVDQKVMVGGTLALICDVVNATTVYYCASKNGNEALGLTIPPAGLSLVLDAGVPAGQIVDLYLYDNAGVLFLGQNTITWGSSSARTNTVAQITGCSEGPPTNLNAITLKNGTAELSIPINGAVYAGSAIMTSAGATSWRPRMWPVAGGCPAVLGLYNAYQQTDVVALCRNASILWPDNVNGWIAADAMHGGSMYIQWLDGLGQSTAQFDYDCAFQGDGFTGVAIDSNGAPTTLVEGATLPVGLIGTSNVTGNITVKSANQAVVLLGAHYAWAVEAPDGPWDGNPVQQTITTLGAGAAVLTGVIHGM